MYAGGASWALWAQAPASGKVANMEILRRTNDIVFLSAAVAALKEAGLDPLVLDEFASAMDGSIGAVPRRLVVPRDQATAARAVLAALEADDGL